MAGRNITQEDKPRLAEMIAADDHHRETTTPEFFFESGTKCLVYESDDTEHQMFIRFSNCLRLDIQFDNEDRRFNARTILTNFPRIVAWAKQKGFTEIVFSSDSPDLIAFLQKKFGIDPIGNEFRLKL